MSEEMGTTTSVPTGREPRLARAEQVLHTETPWHATPAEDIGGGIFIGNDDNHAAFVPGFNDHPHNQANAALIVRAVNAHEDMLALLKMILRGIERGKIKDSSLIRRNEEEIEIYTLSARLRAAITKAEGPTP